MKAEIKTSDTGTIEVVFKSGGTSITEVVSDSEGAVKKDFIYFLEDLIEELKARE